MPYTYTTDKAEVVIHGDYNPDRLMEACRNYLSTTERSTHE